MNVFTSCKLAIEHCIGTKSYSLSRLYKEEKVMKMHIHDCYEIYYSVSGGKQFLIDNKFYAIEPGDLFVINQYESHYVSQVDNETHERIVFSIHPDFLHKISSQFTDLSQCFTSRPDGFSHQLSLSKEEQKRFLYLVGKMIASTEYGSDLIEQAAFMELLVMINQGYLTAKSSPTEAANRFQYSVLVDDILLYMSLHIHEELSLGEIAGNFFISESYLCRIFKSATGMTINKYITARRISIAKSLLSDGLSVGEVCEQCGYNNYSNFVKAFTKAVGISPKKYAHCSIS